MKIDDFTNYQNLHENIEISLKECKKTNSYLYIFAKAVSYAKITKCMEYVLSKNKSKSIRSGLLSKTYISIKLNNIEIIMIFQICFCFGENMPRVRQHPYILH